MTTPTEDPVSPRTWKTDDAESSAPPPRGIGPGAPRDGGRVSGRRFVIASLAAVAGVWLLMIFVLRPGLVGYKQRAEFGRREVAPAVLGLLKVRPPGVEPTAWEDAVRASHGLIATTTDAGSMSIEEQTALRDRIRAVAERGQARPEGATAELAALWDKVVALARKAPRPGEPDIERRHPRPAVFPAKAG